MASKLSEEQQERLREATQNLEEMQKRLAPFIRPRRIIHTTTQGQWKRNKSSEEILIRDGFGKRVKRVKDSASPET